ncbi:MAG: hypothetical protein P1V21_24605 [Rhizobiaceae bacterium]|nr:hypothetical protein [Rhizobiaceae bacterium]
MRIFQAGLFIPTLIAAILCSASFALADEPSSVSNRCTPFSKSFPKDAEFTIQSWSNQADDKDLFANVVLKAVAKIAGQAVTIVEDETTDTDEGEQRAGAGQILKTRALVLTDASEALKEQKIPLNQKGALPREGIKISLDAPLNIDVTDWTHAQKKALIEDGEFSDSIVAANNETGGHFIVDLTASVAVRRQVAVAALTSLEFAKGTEITVKDFDADRKTVSISSDTIPAPIFAGAHELTFPLPYPDTLTMVPAQQSIGSLSVLAPIRALERTVQHLGLTHSNIAFGQTTYRGCIGLKKLEDKYKTWSELDDGDLFWVEISNIAPTSSTAGAAQISFNIPSLPRYSTPPAPGSKAVEDIYAPGMADTLANWLWGGHENTRIVLLASDGNRIVYSGATTQFIDNRWGATTGSILAFLIAYGMIVFYWKANTKNKPAGLWSQIRPLNLVRGHDGTASLSNLQLLWWTLAVFGLMIFVWIATGGLATLNQTIIWLLGVGGVGSLAAKAVAINASRNMPAKAQIQGQNDRVDVSSWQLISVDNRLDLTKLQMLLFTIIAGIYVVTTVWSKVAFPEIPTELLALMGISNGVYVLGKLTNSDPLADNPHARIVGLEYELFLRNGVIAEQAAKHDTLGAEIAALEAMAEQGTGEKERLAALKKQQAELTVLTKTQNEEKAALEKQIAEAKAKLKRG